MNHEKLFENLCNKAQLESIPALDVAGSVIERLEAENNNIYYEKPMAWFAGISSIAAMLAFVAAITVYFLTSDPFNEITNAISWVTL
jgi:hypothetical protein